MPRPQEGESPFSFFSVSRAAEAAEKYRAWRQRLKAHWGNGQVGTPEDVP
jgi:hypothetical protein